MQSKILTGIFILFCLCLRPAGSFAQRLGFVYAHGQYNKTLGSFNNGYGFGIGGEIGAGLKLGGTFLTLMTGYTHFDAVNSTGLPNLRMQPIRGGLRQPVLRGILYIKADAGIARLTPSGGSSFSRFSASGGVGAKLAGLEVEADYAGFTGSGAGKWFGLKAGFNIGF
jgi:hypothetical protein